MAPFAWSGRSDGDGPEHARWHSVIDTAAEPAEGAVHLIGYASDEGVERNGGRQGAAAGPAALRSALGSLAVHHKHALADAGTITTQADDLDGAHDALSDKVQELVEAGTLPRPDLVLWPENASDISPLDDRLARREVDAVRAQLGELLRDMAAKNETFYGKFAPEKAAA